MEAKNIKIKETFEYLYLNEKNLTLAQKGFIASLKKYYAKNKTLSEKQQKTLFEIKNFLPSQDTRFSGLVADNKKHKKSEIILKESSGTTA